VKDKHVSLDNCETGHQVIIRIAYFIGANKEILKQDLLSLNTLNTLNTQLSTRIIKIKTNTSGLKGFFRYLFRKQMKFNLRQQKDNLEVLSKIIDSIIQEANNSKPAANRSDLPISLQVRLKHAAQNKPEKEQKPIKKQKAIQPDPKEISKPAGPAVRDQDAPPPPPPPSPSTIKKMIDLKSFENELEEPKVVRDYKTITQEEVLTETIGKIATYISSLDKAIQPISQQIENKKKLVDNLEQLNKAQVEINETLNRFKTNKKTLEDSKPDEIVYLEVMHHNKIGHEYPYFSDEQFIAYSLSPSQKNLSLKNNVLPEHLKKSVAIDNFKVLISETEKEIKDNRHKIKAIQQKLTAIQSSTNNGISFDEAVQLFTQKLNKRRQLEGLRQNYIKRQQEIKNGKAKIDSPVSIPQPSTESSFLFTYKPDDRLTSFLNKLKDQQFALTLIVGRNNQEFYRNQRVKLTKN